MKNEDGFSLAELMIVMIIIGVLLTLGIGSYLRVESAASGVRDHDRSTQTHDSGYDRG
jgi:prepilin-type N-terminal cleavage/methylation domain-containing protein